MCSSSSRRGAAVTETRADAPRTPTPRTCKTGWSPRAARGRDRAPAARGPRGAQRPGRMSDLPQGHGGHPQAGEGHAFRIGIDVGGTFTDLVAVDEAGRVTLTKVASTPDDPSRGILEGLGLLAEAVGRDLRTR